MFSIEYIKSLLKIPVSGVRLPSPPPELSQVGGHVSPACFAMGATVVQIVVQIYVQFAIESPYVWIHAETTLHKKRIRLEVHDRWTGGLTKSAPKVEVLA